MELNLDKTSNIIKVDPTSLAEAEEEFLIYSPVKHSYIFMSKDPSISDKLHTKLEAHEAREFDRNFFKLKKIEGKDSYHILNIKTEKFVYVSGDHVLGMGGDPTSHHDAERFEFAFEKDAESGCFMIKHAGKFLYISGTVAGIPPCHVIHTKDDLTDGSNIFQLTLEKNAKSAKVEFDLEKAQKLTTILDDQKIEFENPGEEDLKKEIPIKKSFPVVDEFKFESGLEYIGSYYGGQPYGIVTDTGPSIAVSGADVQKSSESVHGTLEQNSTSTVSIAPGRKLTFTSKVEKKYLSVPFTIEVTTSTKKILKGSGTWIGGAYLNTSNNSDASSLDGEDTKE